MSTLALLPNGGDNPLVQIGEVPVPQLAPHDALIAVRAFSINRGETFLLERPAAGWRPGKDVAGHVVRAAQRASTTP
jgi:NADPH2:quinone reductase